MGAAFAGLPTFWIQRSPTEVPEVQDGKLELNPQTVQLPPLIDEVIGTARQLAEQNKNRLMAEVQRTFWRASRI